MIIKKEQHGDQFYTCQEEIVNTLTHAIGILFGIVAGICLLTLSFNNNSKWAMPCVLIYIMGMLSSYISSTWYHALPIGKKKKILRKCDHAAIYLHIAGTYTPFTLIVLRKVDWWGYSIFSFVWVAAIIGVFSSFQHLKDHSYLETICYLLMGCCIFIALKPLWNNLVQQHDQVAFYWLVIGGISYIIGSLLYSLHKIKYMHSIFHIFVLCGSICHAIAIYYILIGFHE